MNKGLEHTGLPIPHCWKMSSLHDERPWNTRHMNHQEGLVCLGGCLEIDCHQHPVPYSMFPVLPKVIVREDQSCVL